ncbi:metal-dependent hydrolase [Haloarchaeobius amylolyticus]|uniref:metal-dependent hydrolase n=1 Tax=Haloarchaeobius amylolyticus TaxID=1198296 RepID=UPI00226EEE20|nr:metal-dependent hydrolase [Haloarchaeobius amylolyticus]
MYAAGHIGLALLAFAPVGWLLCTRGHHRVALGGLVLAALSATLPDLDLFVPFLAHRGPTHTIWFVALCGLTAGVLGTVLLQSSRSRDRSLYLSGGFPGLVVALSVCSHLLGDVITPMGLRAFAPLTNSHATLALVYAQNPTANSVLLLLGSVSTGVWLYRGTRLPPRVVRPPSSTGALEEASSSPGHRPDVRED